jgi:hypothetical protein
MFTRQLCGHAAFYIGARLRRHPYALFQADSNLRSQPGFECDIQDTKSLTNFLLERDYIAFFDLEVGKCIPQRYSTALYEVSVDVMAITKMLVETLVEAAKGNDNIYAVFFLDDLNSESQYRVGPDFDVHFLSMYLGHVFDVEKAACEHLLKEKESSQAFPVDNNYVLNLYQAKDSLDQYFDVYLSDFENLFNQNSFFRPSFVTHLFKLEFHLIELPTWYSEAFMISDAKSTSWDSCLNEYPYDLSPLQTKDKIFLFFTLQHDSKFTFVTLIGSSTMYKLHIINLSRQLQQETTNLLLIRERIIG